MSKTERTTSSGGISFFGILGLVFIVLKLCGVINWSWWLVLLPLYGGIVVVLAVFAVFVMVSAFSKRRL